MQKKDEKTRKATGDPVTFAAIKRRALKELALLPEAYYQLTLSELDALLSGVEARDLLQWRHTRAILTLTYNINVDKKDRKTDAEYMPLPGDKEATPEEETYMPPVVMMHLLANTFGLPLKDNSKPS